MMTRKRTKREVCSVVKWRIVFSITADNFKIKNFFSNNQKYHGVNLAIDTPEDLRRVTWMLETFGERLDLNLAAEKFWLWERNDAI